MQLELHPSELFVGLLSHYSEPTIKPSPQIGEQKEALEELPPVQFQPVAFPMQLSAHPMPSFDVSSQVSGEILNPSPQIGTQVLSRFAFSEQVYLGLTMQDDEHPSLLIKLPSSQPSDPSFIPSPQVAQIPIGEAELLAAESHLNQVESLYPLNLANSLGTLR